MSTEVPSLMDNMDMDSSAFFTPLPWSESESDDKHLRHDGFDVLSETTVHGESESDSSTDESSSKPDPGQDSSSESEVDIDCQTTVPADVFARFLQAGKKAKKRGQHRVHWRNGHLVCQEEQCIDLQTTVPTDTFLSFLRAGEEARRRGQHQQQMEGSNRRLVRIESLLETMPQSNVQEAGRPGQHQQQMEQSNRCLERIETFSEAMPQSNDRLAGYSAQVRLGVDCSTRNSRSNVAQCPSDPRPLRRDLVGQVQFNDKSERLITSQWSHGAHEKLLFLLSMVRGDGLQHEPQLTWDTTQAAELV